jgi:hypothetical protein
MTERIRSTEKFNDFIEESNLGPTDLQHRTSTNCATVGPTALYVRSANWQRRL